MHTVALIGTRAQAIKMAPVVQALRERGVSCDIVLTGQHETTVDELLADFGLIADIKLWDEGEIKTISRGLGWTLRIVHRTTRYLAGQAHRRPITVFVHGDTMTALIGAIAGRLSRNRVAHVEAGLRSGSLFDPFPEEAIRRAVTFITDDAYCPGESCVRSAQGRKRRCINTGENTVLDAVRWATEHCADPTSPVNDRPYVILSAHRMETVMLGHRLRALARLAIDLTHDIDVCFVLHPITEDRLRRAGLFDSMQATPRLHLIPRMGYSAFISLASRSAAVLTDGGGNQEEMSYLGIPTFLLRRRTERSHGLGRTAYLTGLEAETILELLRETVSGQHPQDHLATYRHVRPSAAIADDAAAREYRRAAAGPCIR